jgi:hypothetical protein
MWAAYLAPGYLPILEWFSRSVFGGWIRTLVRIYSVESCQVCLKIILRSQWEMCHQIRTGTVIRRFYKSFWPLIDNQEKVLVVKKWLTKIIDKYKYFCLYLGSDHDPKLFKSWIWIKNLLRIRNEFVSDPQRVFLNICISIGTDSLLCYLFFFNALPVTVLLQVPVHRLQMQEIAIKKSPSTGIGIIFQRWSLLNLLTW